MRRRTPRARRRAGAQGPRRAGWRATSRGGGGHPRAAAPGLDRGLARGAARAGLGTPLVRRELEAPERRQRVDAAGPGRRQGRHAARAIHENDALDDLSTRRLDGRDHREERAAGGEDVVDEEHALAGTDLEAAPELALRAVVGCPLFGEDRPGPELAAGLEREDPPAGRRARDEVDVSGAVVCAVRRRPVPAQLARRGGILEHLELLEVGARMTAALEDEVALAERAAGAEHGLGPLGYDASRGVLEGSSDGRHGGPILSACRGPAVSCSR